VPVFSVLEDMRGREDAILICNLAGDDQDAPINSYLLKNHQEKIAAGISVLAEAGGCAGVIVYGSESDTDTLCVALQPRLTIPLSLVNGPSSPVLREASALYHVIDTGIIRANTAKERYEREFLSYGYQGRPTLVVDAETAYQAARLYAEPGVAVTKHIAVTSKDTEIIEADVGTSVGALVPVDNAGGVILLGGIWGRFINSGKVEKTLVSYSYLCDCLRTFPDGCCEIYETAALYDRIKELSCGRCTLCREGSWQLSAIFTDITKGKGTRGDIQLIPDVSLLINESPICAFGRNMALPAQTCADVLLDALTEHIVSRKCREGRCEGFLNCVIDPSLCTGCGECVGVCPEEAIEGKDGFIHIIDENLCTKCGECITACPEEAVKITGEKIIVPKKLVKAGKFLRNG
jgi:NADH-quinone oxidoreductase subunit F